jgi:SAM-dependent methyltransferase
MVGNNQQCTVCGSGNLDTLIAISQVPTHCNVLYATREEAVEVPRGDIHLTFCRSCGHVFNSSFDPRLMEYTQAYENSLHFSPRFQQYASELAQRLISAYDLRHKDVIDIGCGKGDFLGMLCAMGENRGFGFDPSYVPEQTDKKLAERMTILQEFYSPRFSAYKADLITCRHVLEHIQFPGEFVDNVRESIGDRSDTVVFFEVPNALYTLRDQGIWDLIYEHCSYFTQSSLSTLFTRHGFDVSEQHELYEGQFLGIDARSTRGSGTRPADGETPDILAGYAERFAGTYQEKVTAWKDHFRKLTDRGERVVVWGGGSKGVMFLNTLNVPHEASSMVDINPRKQGKYVAGTGQKIVPPEALRELRPGAVIVMNPIYVQEIRGILGTLGVQSELAVA